MTAGEVEMLLFALERSRAQFAWKCGGLDAAGLHKTHPPSAMTLAGLLKHLALVEDVKVAEFVTGVMGRPMAPRRLRHRSRLGLALGGRRLTRGALRALAGSRRALPRRVGAGDRRRRGRPAVEVHQLLRLVAQPPADTGRPARRVRPPRRPRRPLPRGRRRPRRRGPAAAGMTAAARADPGRAAHHRPGQRGVVRRHRRDLRHRRLPGPVPVPEVQGRRAGSGATPPRRSGPRGSGPRPPAATRTPRPPAGWWPTSTASRRAGSRSSPGRRTPQLLTSRVVWRGRDEDKDDDNVWAVTCFVVRKGYRGRGSPIPSPGPRSTTPVGAAPGRSRRTR